MSCLYDNSITKILPRSKILESNFNYISAVFSRSKIWKFCPPEIVEIIAIQLSLERKKFDPSKYGYNPKIWYETEWLTCPDLRASNPLICFESIDELRNQLEKDRKEGKYTMYGFFQECPFLKESSSLFSMEADILLGYISSPNDELCIRSYSSDPDESRLLIKKQGTVLIGGAEVNILSMWCHLFDIFERVRLEGYTEEKKITLLFLYTSFHLNSPKIYRSS